MDPRNKDTAALLSYIQTTSSELVINISGNLSTDAISSLWRKTLALQQQHQPQTLIFEAKDITYCDSSGAILILELKKRQLEKDRFFCIQNLNNESQELLNFLEQQKTASSPVNKPENFIVNLGKSITEIVKNIRENIAFFGELLVYLGQFLLHPKSLRWRDFWRILDDVGPQALPIVLLIGFLVGVIITFQSAEPFGRFGAQIYIIDLVGLGLVREMGPLMTAILLAGRTASAFAAELGTMKINQEIDAITTMGLESIKFLTLPRIIASIIMTPLLSMFLILAGIIGCFLVMLSLGYNLNIFYTELLNVITLTSFLAGLIKTFVFGAVITSIGCLYGIKTSTGASAVGSATTKAVVVSLIMLVIIDGLFAIVYYILRI